MLHRLKLWSVQCWIFRAIALVLNWCVPEKLASGNSGCAMTDADVWEQAEHDALLAQHAEFVRNERRMVAVLVKVSIGLTAVVLASAWGWMHLTGRI